MKNRCKRSPFLLSILLLLPLLCACAGSDGGSSGQTSVAPATEQTISTSNCDCSPLTTSVREEISVSSVSELNQAIALFTMPEGIAPFCCKTAPTS